MNKDVRLRRSPQSLVRHSSVGHCGEMLHRADSHYFAALSENDGGEVIVRAYQAALRGAGAVLIAAERGSAQRKNRNAWVRLAKISEFERWAEYFVALSTVRVYAELGEVRSLPDSHRHEILYKTGEFLCAVEDFLRDRASQGCRSALPQRHTA